PLEDAVLEQFYKPASLAERDRPARPRPTHYKIVCISLYTDDIERLGKMVAELKRRGHTKANKSQLIRAALDQVERGADELRLVRLGVPAALQFGDHLAEPLDVVGVERDAHDLVVRGPGARGPVALGEARGLVELLQDGVFER